MSLEDREVVCAAGSFIFIPQGARHGFRVGDVPSRKLNFYFPAAIVGYFDDLAAALRRDDVDDDALADVAAAHSMEIVGPPSRAVRLRSRSGASSGDIPERWLPEHRVACWALRRCPKVGAST